jgi:hypothetical protein
MVPDGIRKKKTAVLVRTCIKLLDWNSCITCSVTVWYKTKIHTWNSSSFFLYKRVTFRFLILWPTQNFLEISIKPLLQTSVSQILVVWGFLDMNEKVLGHNSKRKNSGKNQLPTLFFGSRGNVVGWGTMLRAGRSPVRIPDEVDFFNLPNSSSRTMALG